MRSLSKIMSITLLTSALISFGNSSNRESSKQYQETMDISAIEITNEESPTSEMKDMDMSEEKVSGRMEAKTSAESVEIQQTSQPNFIASGAASTINDTGIHKLIRTANLKFKVKDIPEATYDIEQICIRHQGLIMNSTIQNERLYSSTTNISEDSALVKHHSRLTSNLILRVHYTKLDTLLKEIAPLAIEIDYRTIEAQDVTLQLLSDNLRQKRMNRRQKRISDAIDNKGRRLNDVIGAEHSLDQTLEEVDRTILSTYKINDQIEYSTINIQLYQKESTYTEKIAREHKVEEFEPGLGSKASEALYNSWLMINSVFIFLLNIWPIIIVAIIITMVILRRKRKVK